MATPILTAIGVFVAAFTIWNNTENAKKKATIDLIMAERNDIALQEAITQINEMAKIKGHIFAVYASDDDKNFENRKHIIKLLNQREFISAGVIGGALHEKMYKSFSYSMFLRDWNNLKAFIYELRRARNNQTIFQEFEYLATKWENTPLKKRKIR
ncbi:DUF4760 domain-containing protein [Moraxella caviae]|nr:DUF4760 domain-containing protein [Moraxella caviae]